MRGHPVYEGAPFLWQGTIPAGAGTPPQSVPRLRSVRDYPRGCGDTSGQSARTVPSRGLSPRVRGHLSIRTIPRTPSWTIPAGAGTPLGSQQGRARSRDYPRGCGDTGITGELLVDRLGLSPRVRGHQSSAYRRGELTGTIPAGAGTPLVGVKVLNRHGDYPRGCGDTSRLTLTSPDGLGLSPRVRGHQTATLKQCAKQGTIPAGAGTPGTTRRGENRLWDYPRGCGDTSMSRAARISPAGLSPRVRGHRTAFDVGFLAGGTIPAGAGTPQQAIGSATQIGDYPRGCGDTLALESVYVALQGLSPRVRGHHRRLANRSLPVGTIPAGAGTPSPNTARRPACRDYPRGCGDTLKDLNRHGSFLGLSPRVRGHRRLTRPCSSAPGTIPAGAGTPLWPPGSLGPGRDYPRGCGDTRKARRAFEGCGGLSPRVRGHLVPFHGRAGCLRTIPAGAGTPFWRRSTGAVSGDYPRGCGDTFGATVSIIRGEGLSPRVRGHQSATDDATRARGTIPAGAGTPR